MRQSELFTKTRREAPKDEVAKNAQLLIRGGFIDKLHSGVYTYLPLGFRVLKKVEAIIREEMSAIGAQEILMPSLHPKEYWEATGRWESMDDLYKIKDASGREFTLGATHEEIVVPLVKQFVHSYKDLPFAVFQIQNKFRMELRAKSGVLRGREFIMKDLYSFHESEEDLAKYYENMKEVYKRVFKRVGLGEETYLTYASGGSFSRYSHEFQTVTPAGEDTIHICDTCSVAVNEEIIDEQKVCPQCGNDDLRVERAIEVGNIFELKTKFSDPFHLTYKDKEGNERPVFMGCYGIGLGRIIGTVVEVHADDVGMVWPRSIAPFDVHLVSLSTDDKVVQGADMLYRSIKEAGIEVLYDDRVKATAGEKFADADLIGIPTRIVVSKKTIAQGAFEVKDRKMGEIKILEEDEIIDTLSGKTRGKAN